MTGADNEYCKTCGHYFKSTGSEPICNYLGDTGHARILKCKKGGVGCTEHTEFTRVNVPRRKYGIIVSPSEQTLAEREKQKPKPVEKPREQKQEAAVNAANRKPTAKDALIARSLGISTIVGTKPGDAEKAEIRTTETADMEKAMLLYNRGCSDTEIGNAVGLSKYQIARWRKRKHLKSKYIPALYREDGENNGG